MPLLLGVPTSDELLRTPPILHMSTNAPSLREIDGLPRTALIARSNTPSTTLIVQRRLFDALLCCKLPLDALYHGNRRRNTELIRWHTLESVMAPDLLTTSDLLPHGDIYCLAPHVVLWGFARVHSLPLLVLRMSEYCGTYCRVPQTQRSQLALRPLLEKGAIASGASSYGPFYDAMGNPRSFCHRDGRPFAWAPCMTDDGTMTNLWRRPPLTRVSELRTWLQHLQRAAGNDTHDAGRAISQNATQRFDRALDLVIPGAASPLESLCITLLTLPATLGGEGFPTPLLNRSIPLDARGRKTLGQDTCIADASWWNDMNNMLGNTILEVEGGLFHRSERRRALDDARASVLRGMGFTVHRISSEDIMTIDRWDITVAELAREIGIHLPPRTDRFVAQRAKLRKELFATLPKGKRNRR